ncbi:hypothetical protein WA158_002127 [Blastocystis sp. Blastoise]
MSFSNNIKESEIPLIRSIFNRFDIKKTGSVDTDSLCCIIKAIIPSIEEDDDIEDALEALGNDGKLEFDINDVFQIKSYLDAKDRGLSFGSHRGSITTYKSRKTVDQSFHSVEDRERIAFVNHINTALSGDVDLPYLPLNPETDQLYTVVADGVLLCKMINKAAPGTIDERAINKHKSLTVFHKTENLRLALNAASSIGCIIINIGWNDIMEGTPHLILGVIWQIIKVELLSGIDIQNMPNVAQLFEGEENIDFSKIPPQEILLKWFNYHLNRVGCPRRVNNFGQDIQDSECYTYLLYALDGDRNHLNNLQEQNEETRAGHVLQGATQLGVEPFLHPQDIANGNERLNLAFVAMLFKACTGLEEVDPKKLKELLVDIFDTNSAEGREERVYRMWINSLGIKDVQLNNLFSDFDDGLKLAKVMDHLQPGVVNWKLMNMNTKMRIPKVLNCNQCVESARKMDLKIVNIGGVDIVNKEKTLILAIVWQLRRYHLLSLLSTLGGGKRIEDKDVMAWANEMALSIDPSTMTIHSFSDPILRNGIYLLLVISSIDRQAVNWDYVHDIGENGETEAQTFESNARYCISIARKIGATVFITWEDIVECKPKMILAFIASLMYTQKMNENQQL